MLINDLLTRIDSGVLQQQPVFLMQQAELELAHAARDVHRRLPLLPWFTSSVHQYRCVSSLAIIS